MPLLVIYNPVSGSGLAQAFVEEHVLPILGQSNVAVDGVVATEYAGHAGIIVANFLTQQSQVKEDGSAVTVILASGDGTLNEILHHLFSQCPEPGSAEEPLPRISFALVPSGTANALYSSLFPPASTEGISAVDYKLQALHSYLNSGKVVPLTLSVTTLSSPSDSSGRLESRVAPSCVVTSTSLHTSILLDSEALRKDIPGIERFKVAAQQNGKRWYKASVKLLPCPSSGVVQVYDPASHKFVNHGPVGEKPAVDLDGPFFYFLSTVNVDRLEPEFRVTPLIRAMPPGKAVCDLVIVRPLRDPSLALDTEEAREAYMGKLWQVMGAVYEDGGHIRLRYGENGELVSEGEGPVVVEYFRCGGWEWMPDPIDERSHLLCVDGNILAIQSGGRAISMVASPSLNERYAVYS